MTTRSDVRGPVRKSSSGTLRMSTIRPRNSPTTVVTTDDDTTDDESETDSDTTPMIKRTGAKLYKPRTILPQFNPEENKFMEFVSNGNVSGVEKLLNEDGDGFIDQIDFNKANVDGYAALQIAVQREDEAMVKVLLKLDGIDLKDSIFLAIKENNMEMVKMILEYEAGTGGNSSGSSDKEKLFAIGRLKDIKDKMTNSEFDEDVTTLILSAHIGSYQLIEYFYSIGERLPGKPYYGEESVGAHKLKMAFERLRWYKALCNPYYISFMANENNRLDPILQAFNLADEMHHLANTEPEFRSQYEELVTKLGEYTGDLLDLCRSTHEVDLVCSQKEGFAGHPSTIPRLLLAVQNNQVDFVVNSFAQDILHRRWIREYVMDNWRNRNPVVKLLVFVFHILFVGSIIAPLGLLFIRRSSWVKSFQAPLGRFMSAMASYIIFLGLLTATCFIRPVEHDRAPPVHINGHTEVGLVIINYLIVAFVFGHIVSIIRHMYMMGFQYFKFLWNLYEVLTQLVFIITFSCWIWSYLEADRLVDTAESGSRKYWSRYEPLLVAESFFAIAMIMSFGKLLRVFQLHSSFGPLQIALGYMIRDLSMGILFYAITIFSFASGFCMLYKGYHELYDEETPGGTKTHQHELYTSFRNAFEALFWGLYNLSPTDGLEIVAVHQHIVTPLGENSTITHHPKYTQLTGKFLAKSFQVLNVLMFANVIMSMIANTASAVFDDKEREWKFARAQVWLFFGRETIVPSPFNILSIIINPFLPKLVVGTVTKGKTYFNHWSIENCCYEDDEIADLDDQRNRTEYAVLVKRLLQRYFREKAEKSMDDLATAHQVTRIREDVVEMKEKCKRINNGIIFMITGMDQNPKRRLSKKSKRREERIFSLDVEPSGGFYFPDSAPFPPRHGSLR